MNVDSLAMARTAFAAATSADDPTVAAYYLAAARVAVVRAREELDELETLLRAREGELPRTSPSPRSGKGGRSSAGDASTDGRTS